MNPIANDMLTNATGAHWRLIRSVVSPAFTATKTRRLLPLIRQRAAHLTRLAAEEATRGSVEVGAFRLVVKAGRLSSEGERDAVLLGMCTR